MRCSEEQIVRSYSFPSDFIFALIQEKHLNLKFIKTSFHGSRLIESIKFSMVIRGKPLELFSVLFEAKDLTKIWAGIPSLALAISFMET